VKGKSTRYLGMTGTQIGILAGLAVVAMFSIGGLLWIILSISSEPALPAPIGTPIPATPSLTPTKQLTVELTLTITPTAPVIATIAPPGGWVEFQVQGADIWLPDNFVGGDTLDHRSETIQKVSKLGKYFANAVKGITKAPKETVLWMVDKNVDPSTIITSVVVEHFLSTEDKTTDQFIQDDLNSSANGTPVAMLITVNETKKMTLLGREARRLTYKQQIAVRQVIGITYYIKDGADFWSIDYILDPNKYLDMLPSVEQSIHTFNLTK